MLRADVYVCVCVCPYVLRVCLFCVCVCSFYSVSNQALYWCPPTARSNTEGHISLAGVTEIVLGQSPAGPWTPLNGALQPNPGVCWSIETEREAEAVYLQSRTPEQRTRVVGALVEVLKTMQSPVVVRMA